MKPRLDLLIHPGLPKSATTWFQTGLLPRVPAILNIGKGGASTDHGDVRPMSRDLHAAQYRVFSEVDGPDSMYSRYRSSIPDLVDVRDRVVDLIRERRSLEGEADRLVAVLSDEAMATSGGVEVNIGLLAALIEGLRQALDDAFEVRPHVVLTIREQKAWLQSFYAFNHHHLAGRHRNIHEFVAAGSADPQDGPFGLLHYDQTLQLLAWALGDRTTIRMVPAEILPTMGGAAFASQILHFLDDPHLLDHVRSVAEELTQVDINVAPKDGSSTVAVTRTRTSTLVHRSARRFARVARGNGASAGAARTFRRPLRSAYRVFRGTRLDALRPGQDFTVELSDEDRTIIDSLFAASNARTEETTSLPLSTLGYHCG